MTIVSHTKQN